ncbi:MAG: hypothetical protein HY926_03855 [Elusimicrobia bacterium]|nr:hypothetical protein [Elusimicrobiota bacterium]
MKTLARSASALVLTAALSWPASAAAPDWVNQGSIPGRDSLFGVGIGATQEAAVLNALVELAKLKKLAAASGGSEEQRVSAAVERQDQARFGPITVKSKSKDAVVSVGGEELQGVEQASEASCAAGKDSVLVKSALKSTMGGKTRAAGSVLELTYSGLVFGDLVEALPKAGLAMQSWTDPSDFTRYVGLKLALPKAAPLPAAAAPALVAGPAWTSASARLAGESLVAHGKGKSYNEALAEALSELAYVKKAYALGAIMKGGGVGASKELVAKRGEPEQFGPITVTHDSRLFQPGDAVAPEAPGGAMERLEAEEESAMLQKRKASLLRGRTEVKLKNAKGSVSLLATERSVAGAESMEPLEEKTTVAVESAGLDLDDLVAELKSQGAAMRTYLEPDGSAVTIGLALAASKP